MTSTTRKKRTFARKENIDPHQKGLLEGLFSLENVMTGEFKPPEWLVHKIWQRGAYGLVSAPPKSFKSWLMMDLAVAVAADVPFLGKYTTLGSGPVLLLAREDTIESLKMRVTKVLSHRKLLGKIEPTPDGFLYKPEKRPPLWFYTGAIDLGQKKDQDFFYQMLKKMIKPSLVILDPWYRLFPSIDFNKSWEVSPILDWLSYLARDLDTALILVHHTGKKKGGVSPGIRTLGTTIFWGWAENALYLDRPDGRKPEMTISREFRVGGGGRPIHLEVTLGSTFSLEYDVKVLKGNTSFSRLNKGLEKHLSLEQLGYYLDIPPSQLDLFLQKHQIGDKDHLV